MALITALQCRASEDVSHEQSELLQKRAQRPKPENLSRLPCTVILLLIAKSRQPGVSGSKNAQGSCRCKKFLWRPIFPNARTGHGAVRPRWQGTPAPNCRAFPRWTITSRDAARQGRRDMRISGGARRARSMVAARAHIGSDGAWERSVRHGVSARTSRNPKMSSRSQVKSKARAAERSRSGLSAHEPPRNTR